VVEAWPGRKRRKGQRGERLRVRAGGGSASTAGAMMAPSCNITPEGGPKVTEAEEVSGDARPGRIGAAGDMGGGEEGPPEGDGNNDKERRDRVRGEVRADDKSIVKKEDAVQADLDAISRRKGKEIGPGKGAIAGYAVEDECGFRILTVGGKPRERGGSKGDRGAEDRVGKRARTKGGGCRGQRGTAGEVIKHEVDFRSVGRGGKPVRRS
jgi:hypothetical protein